MRILMIHILTFCFVAVGNSQVYIQEPIELINSNPTKRQVENLSSPVKKDQAVNTETYLQNQLLYANVSGLNDSLTLSFPINFNDYYVGMMLYLQMPSTNDGKLFVKTGSLNFKEVKLDHRSLDSGEVSQNRIIQLVYNGNFFELLSDPDRPCPNGFIAPSKDYCIEIQEHDSLTFHQAVEYCMSRDGRLCSWGEWFYACNKAGTLGLSNMVGNMEWIDDGGNYLSDMTVRGSGITACNTSVSEYSGFNRAYRCCYSR